MTEQAREPAARPGQEVLGLLLDKPYGVGAGRHLFEPVGTPGLPPSAVSCERRRTDDSLKLYRFVTHRAAPAFRAEWPRARGSILPNPRRDRRASTRSPTSAVEP